MTVSGFLLLQINITGYWDLYNQVLSDSTSLKRAGAMPSSGLLGMPSYPHLLHLSLNLPVTISSFSKAY